MNEHRTQRAEAISERGYQCEVTGQTEAIEAHHAVPRYLDGPDNKHNYQLLQKEFHRKLHEVTWSDNPHLIVERGMKKRQILNNPYNTSAKERLEELDRELVPEYIEKLMGNLPHQQRERVVEQTLVSNFHTIRDLNIQILQLRSDMQKLLGGEIIEGQIVESNVVKFEKPKSKRKHYRKRR